MKILIITDIHSAPDKIFSYLDENPVDQIIITGDVTEFGPEDYFIETLNKFSEYAQVHALQGNCDPKNANELLDKSNIINIHDNTSNIGDIQVVGFGGSNPTPFDTPNEFSDEILYNELSKYKDVLGSDSYTILVTHAPPLNTNADKIESGAHVGSEGIRKIIEETQPTLNVCGHVHESIGQDKIGDTVVVNPGDAANGHACLLELTDEDIKNKNVNIKIFTIQ
ncbi:MAG: metallophosphoesterase [Methanosphaera sp.]|jgi:Icc-related predicted phosphoesterase|uniref:metallophosphoesterase family protein n=1 Tax=Methanosphaera TaxID=2316 RepID=UPI00238023DC|nr:metallophosphoesterase [Candidatus Methanosphaera massiliense]MDD6285598.1 metallophosphoesterase family protein [Methanobacteriaceae archaeon]MDE4079072.1 metallophosphoesterase family protein [Candidatus Methanosphaera massiliense]MDY2744523.1 metallophosphoesterase family protein [Methanosphaera sp.]